LLEACDTNNASLFYMIQRTLTNIYCNLSATLDAERQFISDSFVKECLACLKSMHSDTSTARTEKQKKDSLKFICQMMSTFFEGTEENGIAKLRMHRQLDYGEFFKKIVVETKMPFRKGKDANFIEIATYANMTVWELKTIIA
jgi:hypothetical protein